MKSWIKRIVVIGAILLFAAACTPQELKAFYEEHGIDTSQMSDADLTAQAAAAPTAAPTNSASRHGTVWPTPPSAAPTRGWIQPTPRPPSRTPSPGRFFCNEVEPPGPCAVPGSRVWLHPSRVE